MVMVIVQGGTLISISGRNFKDRGTVRLTNGIDTHVCVTPPLGSEGNLTGPYYAKDGKLIRVRLSITTR